MKKLLPYPFVFFSLLLIGIWYMQTTQTVPSITYFPKNETNQFQAALTKIDIHPDNDASYRVSWQAKSTTSEPAYLRQDISFLFESGELRGVRSSWKQHIRTVDNKLSLPGYEDALWQSITLHYAEIHDEKEKISSIQQSTSDKQYVHTDASGLHSFRNPTDKKERQTKEHLEHITNKSLWLHWSKLAHHFNLQLSDYIVLGLTDLQKYEKESLPGVTKEQSDAITGRLWEGIYKNYLLPAVKYKQNELKSHMPCILLDMKNKEIIVLFDLNGEPYKLIQQIP